MSPFRPPHPCNYHGCRALVLTRYCERHALAPTGVLTVVCGPPCAGKSTYAESLALPILDWDVFYARAAGVPVHIRAPDDTAVRAAVERAFREAMIHASAQRIPTAVIRTAPKRQARDYFREQFEARVVVCETSAQECLARLHRTRPEASWRMCEDVIREWWATYTRSAHDEVIGSPGGWLSRADRPGVAA